MTHKPFTDEQIERFWSKVNKEPGQGPEGECWNWTGGMKTNGQYGGYYLSQINNTVSCHKFAFLLVHNFGLDEIPKDIVVRHSCNNPPCVRPEHLLLGTHKDNSQDMVKAGRSCAGLRNTKSIITPEIAREIRRDWSTGERTKASIAEERGLRDSVVWQVVNNVTWHDPNYVPPTFPKSNNHAWRYTQEEVNRVREMRLSGIGVKRIVSETGISMSQVYNILKNKQRKEV